MTASDKLPRVTFLPDLCGMRALFGVVIIAELLAIVLTLAGSGIKMTTLEHFSLMSLFSQWVGLSAAAVLCLGRRMLDKLTDKAAAVLSYCLILLVVYLISEIAWWVIRPLTTIDPVIEIERTDFLIRTFVISAIVGALALRYFYLQHYWKLRTVSEARARLEALQARIRPHFLFNCMNTIASLTRTDPSAAERAIEDLADLLRAGIGDTGTLVSLAEEFELVRGYLNIEALRLGSRLKTEWATDALPTSVRVPRLTLQPLVENAINHGIEPLPDGGVIRISGRVEGAKTLITITNPQALVTNSQHEGNHLGQENVAQRLQAHFGTSGRLDINAEASHYSVTVVVPTEINDAYSYS